MKVEDRKQDIVRFEETYNDEEAFRLIQFSDNCYELYRAPFEWRDDGDCESGPRLVCDRGLWKLVEEGIGYIGTLADEIAHYHDEASDAANQRS